MNEEEAVKIFDLVVKERMLPATLDKLVPLSFIGAAAVKFYQAKVKLMDQLGMSEAQRKVTLEDGQDAGEMLLNIEARIGELVESIPTARRGEGTKGGSAPSLPSGITGRQSHLSQAIHRNPAAVAAVIKQARENEDIPTKTAVLKHIELEKERKRKVSFENTHPRVNRELNDAIDESVRMVSEMIIPTVKEAFANPDTIDPKKFDRLVGLLGRLISLISEKGKTERWKKMLPSFPS